LWYSATGLSSTCRTDGPPTQGRRSAAGGIGLATGTLVALAITHTHLLGSAEIALLIAGLGLGAIGFVDDLTGAVPVTLRLALQLAGAAVVVAVLWEHTSFGMLPVAVVGTAASIWIVSFVNAFNFMDGINGISCAETIVAGVAFGLIARHEHQVALEAAAFAIVAGAIGFAPFNFPTARVFLGDVGSYFARCLAGRAGSSSASEGRFRQRRWWPRSRSTWQIPA